MTKHAYITPDTKSKNKKALWLIVEREEEPAKIDGIMGMFRDEDMSDNVAYPILEDEVKVIMNACEDYLKSKKCYNKLCPSKRK